MNALKEIIRLRGGIEKLNGNRLLRIVIFWYWLHLPISDYSRLMELL